MVVGWHTATGGGSLSRISELPRAVVEKTVLDAAVTTMRIMDV